MNALLRSKLEKLQAAHLYRTRRVRETPQGSHIILNGHKLLNFSSNDYLGLANHPEVIAAFHKGAERWGVGSGAAHLITGHCSAHQALEEELAAFTQRSRALLFASGYIANLGIISTLAQHGDNVWEDRLNHASLLDGALLARANLRRYPHLDIDILSKRLQKKDVKLIATDGVFSMDGDLAPLSKLAVVAQEKQAWLLVDDAHGLGVIGPEGRGSVGLAGLSEQQIPLLLGTLGKAFGTCGAFVAGSEEIIEYLIQTARAYIYSTAPPPALAEATRVSLKLAMREAWRRSVLQERIAQFRHGAQQSGINLPETLTPIQPLLIGDSARALQISKYLEQKGIFVPAIRPPTVPKGTARLRITFSALHTIQDIEQLLIILNEALSYAPARCFSD